jgi:hypothetical protein
MPILMKMYWEGIKPEQYEKLHAASNFETDTPKGAIFHTSAFDKVGMHVVDLWETAEDFNNFVETRLKPEVKRLGIKEQPQVEISTIHRTFVPGYNKILSREKQKA